MSVFFQFESEFVDALHCIPMIVRFKLDTCGVKLKLVHWNQFTPEERKVLVVMPCETPKESQEYKDFLQALITDKTGSPAGELPIDSNPFWLDDKTIPDQVQEKAAEFEINLSLEQWEKLTPIQRFALIKLSRSSHENRNFYPALQEFQLI
ncbi:nitrate reductase associated protein [Crocosphaera sp. XPORK-15E]|uniref:nitrate reductase associated protein n=1 Tax=Crocosphaera sp. XPORK-15E TaxID=3110247 RepID=UPI002B214B26|nr:nitrate reductase associated protein [Crocosphaera sp. XPORK-15E]MEA5533457.1 nitrate reductase associated protein [Crocosphaera sp. XPORK-15E]